MEDFDSAIISQAYTVFKITNPNELLPEYLMMWFRRPEFDRYARFRSHGSARETFDWEEMCEVELPIPSIEKQQEIVNEYSTVVNRITLNEELNQKLEETAQTLYTHWFVKNIDFENLPKGWKKGCVGDLCEYSKQRILVKELDLNNYISTENILQDRRGILPSNNLPKAKSVPHFDVGNILISNIRPYFKKIWLANFSGGCSNDVLCIVPKKQIPSIFLYQVLEKDSFFEYVMAGSKGTKMPRGDKKWIMNYPTVIPSKESLDTFEKLTNTLHENIQQKRLGNKILIKLEAVLLSKMIKTRERMESKLIE